MNPQNKGSDEIKKERKKGRKEEEKNIKKGRKRKRTLTYIFKN